MPNNCRNAERNRHGKPRREGLDLRTDAVARDPLGRDAGGDDGTNTNGVAMPICAAMNSPR
jgi:hypothetical protein